MAPSWFQSGLSYRLPLTLHPPWLPHHGLGPSLACAAQFQTVQASTPVPLQYSGDIRLLYLHHQARLLRKQHRQCWKGNGVQSG